MVSFEEGVVFMRYENEVSAVAVLDSPACGGIDPQLRAKAGEISDDRVDQLAAGIGEHYVWIGDKLVEVDGVKKPVSVDFLIPKWCVDGRWDEGETDLAPNAAGGTYSLVVGDALIDADSLIESKSTSASHGAELFTSLTASGYDIGGHEDSNASGENCGCGACDRMATIIGFLGENIEELSQKAAALGANVSEDLKKKIATNAIKLVDSGYISSGAKMNKSIKETTNDSHSQKLLGSHNEVLLVVNTVEGTTLNRSSILDEYGDKYQAFNLDVWALKNGINAISISEAEANEKFTASILYNLATACVLAGPSLRVVVR